MILAHTKALGDASAAPVLDRDWILKRHENAMTNDAGTTARKLAPLWCCSRHFACVREP